MCECVLEEGGRERNKTKTQETAYPTISGFQYIVIGWGQWRWKDV